MEKHEIMTLEEVATYLRVSERTVYDWAQKSEIPCGKLGTVWRFKRSEIEKWVDSNLSARQKKSLYNTLCLGNLLSPDRVKLVACDKKKEVLDILIDCIAQTPHIKDKETLAEGIYYRESLMSTGIGMGMAVPHVRMSSVKDMVMAAVVSSKDILDYDSIDSIPIRIVFMIVANKDQHAQHIKALSSIANRIKDPALRKALFMAKTPEEFYRLMTE